MEIWIWVLVIALAVIVEITTDQMVSFWFIPGALAAIILDCFNCDVIWQVLTFAVVTLIGIFALRRFLVKFIKTDAAKTNLDTIIGEKCIVIEEINNFAGCGQVKVKGQVWSARGCAEDDVFHVGDVLSIVAIEGVKLICKKS